MDASVRTALETAAKRYFEMSARGDVAALKQSSIAAVAPALPESKARSKRTRRHLPRPQKQRFGRRFADRRWPRNRCTALNFSAEYLGSRARQR